MAEAFRDGEQALRRALEVFTRENFPQEWARTQIQLAMLLSGWATDIRSEIGRDVVQQVTGLCRDALRSPRPIGPADTLGAGAGLSGNISLAARRNIRRRGQDTGVC